MKRSARVFALIIAIMITAAGFAFAEGASGGLELVDTYPKEGSSGAAIENFDVKLYFNNEMSADILGTKNDSCFKLTDQEGNELPIIVLYAPKEEGVCMVLFDQNSDKKDADGKPYMIKGDTEYSLTISPELTDDFGNTLGEEKVVKFKTINQQRNTIVNLVLMLVLYAGIIGFTMRNAKKKAETQAKEEKFNPYKEAKRTGKSVEEVIEKENRRKPKSKEDEDDEDYVEEEIEDVLPPGHYRVKAARTVKSGGSSYITGRKEAAEKRAALEEKYAKSKAKKGKGKKK